MMLAKFIRNLVHPKQDEPTVDPKTSTEVKSTNDSEEKKKKTNEDALLWIN